MQAKGVIRSSQVIQVVLLCMLTLKFYEFYYFIVALFLLITNTIYINIKLESITNIKYSLDGA